ncbi:MAG TPA: chemotaxis protein CheB [Luteimonas sp.]|nr:chemotaxis protein CheB [Luteimonas sp.]
MSAPRCDTAVIGCSAGGLKALQTLIPDLRGDLAAPVIVVCHTSGNIGTLCELIGRNAALPVREARERMRAAPGVVYVAPADYHLLLEHGLREHDLRFALSVDPRVTYARPSIDVLFESAANACGPRLLGVILTGGNHDGAAGLKRIRDAGGIGIVQRPESAEAASMPAAALALAGADHCVTLAEIGPLLNTLCMP